MTALLFKFWPEILVALILAAAGAAYGVVVGQRNHARAQLAACQADYELAKQANDAMKAAVEQQNEAVAELQRQATQRAQLAKIEQARAEVQAKPIEQRAASIAALQLPDDECSALRLIVDGARK